MPLALYAWYRLAIKSGWLRRQTPAANSPATWQAASIQGIFTLPAPALLESLLGAAKPKLIDEAGEILSGVVRLFGGEPVPLDLEHPGPVQHWTAYERAPHLLPERDIKYYWEPARFGWVFTLGRAYRLTGDERYPRFFWKKAEQFLQANPPNLGLHWLSAQEVALRLLALLFAGQVFEDSAESSQARKALLVQAVVQHAQRIPASLAYARSQRNNHLISEALGLLAAGVALPSHPQSKNWKKLGWRWFNRALQDQIHADGAYTQQSSNYHRLMLQLALMGTSLARQAGFALPAKTQARLQSASHWLEALLDPISGRVPNLGPNDGALVLPFQSTGFEDYRPLVQASLMAFANSRKFAAGPLDELALWTGVDLQAATVPSASPAEPWQQPRRQPLTLRSENSWGYLRAAQFTDRPGHADQLHLDLWWQGFNIAQDAGTFLYNAAPPWDNSLSRTAVHNTLSINQMDQMQRAGKFLWLQWAQAFVLSYERAGDGSWERLIAEHNGYRSLGLIHRRRVTLHAPDRWVILDRILPAQPAAARTPKRKDGSQQPVDLRLHWLLPDWPFSIQAPDTRSQHLILLDSPHGQITLRLDTGAESSQDPYALLELPEVGLEQGELELQIVRAGNILAGPATASSTWGWVSPTYGQKLPALSVAASLTGIPPLTLRTEFIFPKLLKE